MGKASDLANALSKIKLTDILSAVGVDLAKIEADADAYVAKLKDNITNSPQLTDEQKAKAIADLQAAQGVFEKYVNAALPQNLIGLGPAILQELKDLVTTKHSVVVHTPVEVV